LYGCIKPDPKYFVVQFDFQTKVWKCKYDRDGTPPLAQLCKEFEEYKCFFILDSIQFERKMKFSCFDGIIVAIGSPKSVISLNQICKYNDVHSRYYYFPLWEDSEFKIFMEHFDLSNEFLNISEKTKSDMGLEKLSKSEIFGNNPRMLKFGDEDVILRNLQNSFSDSKFIKYISSLTLTEFQKKNTNLTVHRIFSIKPGSDYRSAIIIPASCYMACIVNRYFDYLRFNDALSNYKKSISSNNPSFIGINFETLFHAYVRNFQKNCVININLEYKLSGRRFESFDIQTTYTFDVSNYIRADEITFSIISNGKLNDKYIVPKKFNFPTFDSVFRGKIKKDSIKKKKEVALFFQCTIGDNHDIKGEGYSIIKEFLNLPNIEEVALIFIVPHSLSSFTPVLGAGLNFDKNIKVYLGSIPAEH
jgi:hypothetical protein